ncbi:hypothetical protein [Gracilimonas mengyeensis]|nr:hypothetical protein [Gracilimonas mengyeensis]
MASSGFAQQANFEDQNGSFRLGLFWPNLEYETPIHPKMTFHSETGFAFNVGHDGMDWVFQYGLFAKIGPRYYYNLEKRLEENKSIRDFSGNYFSFVSMAYLNEPFDNNPESNQFVFGPTWGLQRNLGKNWYFNFEVGPGISLSESKTKLVPIIGLDIGIKF